MPISSAVSAALAAMPTAAKLPSSSDIWNARAVPRPCAATPRAKPRARRSAIRIRRSRSGAVIAPNMPLNSATSAASDGMPPVCSAIAMATGAVAARGARVARSAGGAPNSAPTATAEPMAVTEPATSAAPSGTATDRIRGHWCQSGTAKATVAEPRRSRRKDVPAA
jgi:hypothetical protein